MLNSGVDIGRILGNCSNALVTRPILKMCTITDNLNCVHVQAVSLIIFCSNKLCCFLIDSTDMGENKKFATLLYVPEKVQARNAIAQFMSFG